MSLRLSVLRFAFLVLCGLSARAADPSPTPAPPGTIDEKLFRGMQWRQVGPFRGGRALAIEGIANEPGVYYFGAVAGGVWKTTDGGANWSPLFDKESISSIGAIAVAPSDHNVIYAGTGEAAVRGNISYGNGVYKSVDAEDLENHWAERHPAHRSLDRRSKNPDIVLVAALGHIFGPNQNGEFSGRPTGAKPGRKSWAKIRTRAESMSCSIRKIRILFSRLSGRRDGSPGIFRAAVLAAGFIGRRTAAKPGSDWKARDCRMGFSAVLA